MFRICLGIGMGGEWASGAALVSETWPERHRGKALALMQSSWAIGYGLAALVNWVVQDVLGLDWRAVFFVGVLPALFTFWIRRGVEEPAMWRGRAQAPRRHGLSVAPGGRRPMLVPITVALTLMNACTMFACWGFNTWVPSYLRRHRRGGIGLGTDTMTAARLRESGRHVVRLRDVRLRQRRDRSEAHLRRRTCCSAAVLVLGYTSTSNVWALLALGPVTSFFATGYFSGFGAVTAELYPTAVRATAQGFTYNIGRVASAAAPWLVGSVARTHGFPVALSLSAAVLSARGGLLGASIPETKGGPYELRTCEARAGRRYLVICVTMPIR